MYLFESHIKPVCSSNITFKEIIMNTDSTQVASSLPEFPVQDTTFFHEISAEHSGSINTAGVIRVLIAAFLTLLALNVFIIYGYQTGSSINDNKMLYFDTEGNLPTYFNTFILLLSSFILAVITIVKKGGKDAYSLHWSVLTFIFLCLAVDEALGFHELLMDPLRFMFNLSGILRFAWVIVGITFVLIFCVSYFKFFLYLSKPFRIKFFLSGFVYVCGAIVLEMIGGYFFEHVNYGRESLVYMTIMTLEESFEMCGIILFVATLLSYLKVTYSRISINFN